MATDQPSSFPFPPSLNLAVTPTPLQALDRLSAQLGGPRLWVKRDDLTGSHLSGNKVRKLEFVLAQALAEGCDTLITCGGIQSNHCRATAFLGAQLGLEVQLILRGEDEAEPDGNLFLDYLAGANVATYAKKDYAQRLPELLNKWQAHYEKQGKKPFVIPTGASDEVGLWGYVRCCQELQADFEQQGISPSAIVSASGSGGTQAGLVVGNSLFNLNTQIIGMAVCDNEEYFRRKVMADITAWQERYDIALELSPQSIQTNDQHIGPGYARATPEIYETIKLVARTEGLVLDPVYSGKAFHGLLEEIKLGQFKDADDIVFIHTGGIFGVFSQREEFNVKASI